MLCMRKRTLPSNNPHTMGDTLEQRRTELSVFRTRIAAERTLMAWIRTALSFIGFGFTIFGFFRFLPNAGPADVAPASGPYIFGIILVVMGTIALAAALAQHVRYLAELGIDPRMVYRTLAFVFATLIVLSGLVLMVIMIALMHSAPTTAVPGLTGG